MLNLRHVLTIAVTVFVFPGLVTAVHSINFGIARTFVLPVLFRIPVVSMLLRPVAAHFLKGSWTLTLLLHHTSIIRRAFYLGRLTMVVWELAEGAFDAIVSEVSHSDHWLKFQCLMTIYLTFPQPITVSHLTADPVLTLVSGITSSDLHLKHFAYAELRALASDESPAASARRTELFADQKYSPSLWSTLARESLVVLGKDYQLLLGRGKAAAPGKFFNVNLSPARQV